ncbi:MAG TPA: NAD(P)H-dependent oxidoreductase [Smithellaceae bacterium]|nr:NAD(P)H-dependent oxidoreductase [Smithellaceae bacterium]
MNRVLILFAHPRFEQSKTNRTLLAGVDKIAGVTLHDLYEEYPDFNINVARERALLLEHSIILFHHPFYMYSAPALLKQWMDVVLEYGWARGSKGNAVKGKTAGNVLTVGGTRQVYAHGALHRFTIREFLVPFEQSADLCKMKYLPPFVVHGTHLLTDKQHHQYAARYFEMLSILIAGAYDPEEVNRFEYFNDWLEARERRS